jgi:hypothetical protein
MANGGSPLENPQRITDPSLMDLEPACKKSGIAETPRLKEVETHTQGLGNIVLGVFTPVLAKHTKSFNLVDTLSVGWTGFNGTSSRCSARSNCGGRRRSPTTPRG